MKRFLISILLIIVTFSCEDVIEVDLPEEEPRLVIDGILRVDKTEEFVGIKVKMSLTSSFFDEIMVTSVDGANIVYGVEDEQGFMDPETIGNSTLVERVPGSGIYEPDLNSTRENRIRTANLNQNITLYLTVSYNDRLYLARTMYAPSASIDGLEQGDDTLFEEDDTELILTYTDDEDLDNYYVFDFDMGNFITSEDKFYQGQQFQFSYFYDQDLENGEELEVSILGADRQFYNYMNLLLQQTEEDFNIFDTPAATIRGNIFDVTDIDNNDQFDNTDATDTFPLGYFAVVEEFKQSITIQK